MTITKPKLILIIGIAIAGVSLAYFNSDDSEGNEGNEGSIEDKVLPILFSIAELL